MLSILIPLFRFDPLSLVNQLKKQCEALTLDYEIVCMDDASGPDFEKILHRLEDLSNVRVIRLPENIGRSKIRNRLVDEARYDKLLFLDSDGMPHDEYFIENYLENRKKADVICGGRSYSPTPPEDPDLWLHWHYGSKREVIPASLRNEQGWLGFQTNNFMAKKELFSAVRFNEEIRTYGHEDTLFGQDCKKAKFTIQHIENPAVHIGLEQKEEFLKKMNAAVTNLVKLQKRGVKIHTKLSKKASALQYSIWLPLVQIGLIFIRPLIKLNIKRQRPFLTLLDVQKLDNYLNLLK